MCDIGPWTASELSYAACSREVNVAPHAKHLLRRQTLFVLFCSREFVTFVSCPQYIHTIATYCHAAIKKASGKLGGELWAKKYPHRLQVQDGGERDLSASL